ncbi:MAG: PAS domain-containing protein, partial [Mariprofundaceae bacterium]|nr:PAS domain-containing protein [Mariprofundaceae bacterium]
MQLPSLAQSGRAIAPPHDECGIVSGCTGGLGCPPRLHAYRQGRRKALKQYIIQNWLINRNQPGGNSIIHNQLQQTWARFGFALAGLIYLYVHAERFDAYASIFLPVVAAYFIYNALSLAAIKRRPLSAFRMLFSPLFDVIAVSFGILMDGGQTSGIYLVLYVIIFGNGFRFGNALLLYTQALSFLGMTAVCIITLAHLHIELDKTLLFWQLAGLLAIPLYVYLIGEKAEKALLARDEAEKASFSLLDQGPLPVFTYDLDADDMPRILYANAAMATVYRDSHTHLIGEQVDILALMEDGDEMLNACRNVLKEPTHKPHRFYIRGRDRHDEILQLMCQVSRLRWRGHWIGVCFILDITQRERLLTQMD